MAGTLNGKRVIVAGALGTIGIGIVRALLNEGANVFGLDLLPIPPELVVSNSEGDRFAVFEQVDLADKEMTASYFADFSGKHDELFAVVNTIGVAGPKGGIADLELGELPGLFSTNVISAFNLLQYSVPLIRQGGQGRIVLIGSVAGKLGYKGRSAYAASKWAIEGLSRSLAEELGPEGISVNVVAPGPVDSAPLHQAVEKRVEQNLVRREEAYDDLLSQSAQGILVDVQAIASVIIFLLSSNSLQISGQSISVDGCTSRLS